MSHNSLHSNEEDQFRPSIPVGEADADNQVEAISWDITNTAWHNALKKAGLTDFRFHDLRHT